MEKRAQQSTRSVEQEVCSLCSITYSIYSSFPPMPSAQALNAETGEFFPFERMQRLSSGYAMAEALGYAWACTCRGRLPTPSQNLDSAQAFGYAPVAVSDDVLELAGSQGMPGNNQAQNKQTRDVATALGLNKNQAQRLHREIGGQGFGYHEIMERAKDMFNLW